MSTLTIISQALAYEDSGANSNPTQRPIDWKRTIAGLPVENPSTVPVTIEPLGTATVIDGTRATSVDGTTAFSLSASSVDSTRYRILNTGGTAPVFRTARSITVSGIQLTLVVGANLAVTVTAGSGTPFVNIQPGDVVFLPGAATGDSASPFNALNVGYWTALTVTSTVLTMVRPTGTIFSGVGEVVTPTANAQLQAFSTAGVQIGDTLELAAGFASTALRAYDIVAVNPSWVEIVSTLALGAQTGILPTASGFLVYTNAKRWLALEVNQECAIRVNNDSGSTQRVTPWLAGDKSFPGQYSKTGPVWKLQIVNRANVAAQAVVFSAE